MELTVMMSNLVEIKNTIAFNYDDQFQEEWSKQIRATTLFYILMGQQERKTIIELELKVPSTVKNMYTEESMGHCFSGYKVDKISEYVLHTIYDYFEDKLELAPYRFTPEIQTLLHNELINNRYANLVLETPYSKMTPLLKNAVYHTPIKIIWQPRFPLLWITELPQYYQSNDIWF